MDDFSEVNEQLKEFDRQMIEIIYHLNRMMTFGKYGTSWTDEVGTIADNLAKASAIMQGVFDQLTGVNNAGST